MIIGYFLKTNFWIGKLMYKFQYTIAKTVGIKGSFKSSTSTLSITSLVCSRQTLFSFNINPQI